MRRCFQPPRDIFGGVRRVDVGRERRVIGVKSEADQSRDKTMKEFSGITLQSLIPFRGKNGDKTVSHNNKGHKDDNRVAESAEKIRAKGAEKYARCSLDTILERAELEETGIAHFNPGPVGGKLFQSEFTKEKRSAKDERLTDPL